MRSAMCSIDESLTLKQGIFSKDPVCLLNAILCKQHTLKQKTLPKEPIIEIKFSVSMKPKQWIIKRLPVIEECVNLNLVVYD